MLIGATYSTNVTVNGHISLLIFLAITFGITAFMIFILAAGFCFWKFHNPAYLHVVRMADGTGKTISLCMIVLLSLTGYFEIEGYEILSIWVAMKAFTYQLIVPKELFVTLMMSS